MRIPFILTIIILISGIALADSQYRMGDHLLKRGNYNEALQEYRKFEDSNPNDPELLWRIGAALTRLAKTEKGNTRHNHLEEATNYINRSLVKNCDILKAHLEYARALGYLALFKPDWDDVRVARRVREELQIVLKEEDKNADAYFLMGLWHRWVGPLPLIKRHPNGLHQADLDSSVYYISKAVDLDDDNLEFKIVMAETHMLLGDENKAKTILEELARIEEPPLKYLTIPDKAGKELESLQSKGEINEK